MVSRGLAEGWLVPLLGFTFSVLLIPFGRLVARKWRAPLDEQIEARKAAEQREVETRSTLADVRLECYFLKARVESLERELGHWESGRWSRGS